jgi:integrase
MYIARTPPYGTSFDAGYSQPLTVAAALALVGSWPDLPPLRRRDLSSSLTTIARIIGMPPDAVVLTPAALREALFPRLAAGAGLTSSRQSNVLSGLRAVLRHVGVIDDQQSRIDECWDKLLAPLNTRRRAALSTFAGYCSGLQISPDRVTDATLSAFELWLTNRTITANPRKRASDVRGAWNRAGSEVAEWPALRFARLRQVGQYILPLSDFPETFQADLELFGRRLASDPLDVQLEVSKPLDEGSISNRPKKPLRPISVALRKDHARWAASAVAASGIPVSGITCLADLVSPPERAQQALLYLRARNDGQPSAGAMHVADVLRMIAKYHARLPPAECALIASWRKAVSPTYDGMTPKNELVVIRAMAPATEARLRHLPDALMRAARKERASAPQKAHSLALRAVAVKFLTHIPLRLANLTHLRLDRHLQRANPPNGPITHIQIQASEVKNGRAILVPISKDMAQILDEWVCHFRPLIAPQRNPYLFAGRIRADKAITPQAMRDAIKGATRGFAGVTITPHQFRHLAACIYLEENPGCYEVVRQLLGHALLQTTVDNYCRVESTAALKSFDDLLQTRARMRQPLSKSHPSASGKSANARSQGQ